MKKLIIYSSLFLMLVGLTNCKKILNKVDFNGVPNDQVWNNADVVNIYLSNLYQLIMPVYYSNASSTTIPTAFHNISDECNGGSTAGILNGTLTSESETDYFTSSSAGYWFYIRRINLMLTNIDGGGLPKSVIDPMKAQAYFLRGWCYYNLMKVYGGVPYITKPLDWITDSLNLPRLPTSQLVDSIIRDLSYASILPTTWSGNDQGRITSSAALAVKARVLLLWASPQFNPQNDGARWERAYTANRSAYDSLTAAGYALYSNYSRIALDASNAADKEPILFRAYNGSTTVSQIANNWESSVRPYSGNNATGGKSYNPTWNLVQAYPMADGKSITTASVTYPYNDTFYWKNRDPRFYSTIVYNGAVYGLGGVAGRKQWNYPAVADEKTSLTTTGFYCRKNVDTSIAPVNSQYGKTWWVELRMGEVLLNLAECANATGRQSEALAQLVAIRKRAGIKPGTDGNYGLDPAASQAAMQDAIMLERRIELAFEDKRNDDLRRTRTFDKLNGITRNQLVITINAPYKQTDLDKTLPNSTLKMRDTIDVENPTVYKKFFSTKAAPITGEAVIAFQPAAYVYGIPSSNISKQPALQQTIGWPFAGAAGTFDPTK
ncbi:MAG: RagB/SusD family nutrient uptake outer membrane protein [Bacteroidetes bacterium]|nr:RagB/SusD family nutrient uptake outer membrane protein [Bacteroidota bacterium]